MTDKMVNNLQSNESQWNNIPAEVKEVYTKATEPLYTSNLPVESIAQQEANIYNSIFGQYGLHKPVRN